MMSNLLSGQYERPVRVVACNPSEGWARDVTADIAGEALTRLDQEDISPAARVFVEVIGRLGAKPEQL